AAVPSKERGRGSCPIAGIEYDARMKSRSFAILIALTLASSLWMLAVPTVGRAAPAEEGGVSEADADARAEAWRVLNTFDLRSFLGEGPLAVWLVPLAAILLGLVAGRISAAVLGWLGKRCEARGWKVQQQVFAGLVSPANLVLFTLGLAVAVANLPTGLAAPPFWEKVIQLLFCLAVLWYVSNLIFAVEVALRRLVGATGAAIDEQLGPLIRRTLRVALWIVGVLFIAQSVFEQDIGAWLAGLGIAGLAISLAAQDSLKNLFGSVMILLDRPFRIGERIQFSGHDGVVEEIGFRSTKLRTLTGHLVTIPNSKIVNDPVENVARRPTIRRTINVTITYDTPLEKITQGVELLRGILEEEGIREPIHPVIDGNESPPRVYFNDYNAESLNLFVIYWYAPPAYWDYMEHAQRLNLRVFEEFEKAGIEFAFPTQTLYLAGDPKRRLAVEMLNRGLDQPG
ncbi:MAG: mechanosensitive ion channel family protein, partial [Planctomycetota bacterium]